MMILFDNFLQDHSKAPWWEVESMGPVPELRSAGRATAPSKCAVGDGASALELLSNMTCHISEQMH